MTPELLEIIENDRKELSGNFCRACAYCMPCPNGVPVAEVTRMKLQVRRMPYQQYLSDAWKAKMDAIEDCVECGLCSSRAAPITSTAPPSCANSSPITANSTPLTKK